VQLKPGIDVGSAVANASPDAHEPRASTRYSPLRQRVGAEAQQSRYLVGVEKRYGRGRAKIRL